VPRHDGLRPITRTMQNTGDIIERRDLVAAVQEKESLFRIMADGCPAFMWVTNAEGRVEFINRAYREFIGAPLDQVEGLDWAALLHPDDAQAYLEACDRALRERAPLKSETRLRSVKGEWWWVATYAEPRFSPSGEFRSGVIVVVKADGAQFLNTSSKPATAGDALVIYCAGLGAVNPAVPDGTAAPSSPLANTVNPVTVTVGGQSAQVFYSGLAPGFVGLYQVNVIVPSGIAAAANVPLVLIHHTPRQV
jgi:PAS domain S-box-containing protein